MASFLGRFYNRLFADSIPPPAPAPRPTASKRANWWLLIKQAGTGFMDDRGLKLSAALAYYTVFSLAPLLVLVISLLGISLLGIFLGEEAIQGQIVGQINGLVGNEAAKQIQAMIKSSSLSGKSSTALIISIGTLLVGATSVFVEIQDSINLIWRVKPKPQKGWLKLERVDN